MLVSCGIPDFPSGGVGLYDTFPLDRGLFLQNPLPMLETKRGFILGMFKKRFVEMLHTKLGKLLHPEHRWAGVPDASPEGEGGQRGEWHSEGWGKCRIPGTSYHVQFGLRSCNMARAMDR